MTAAPLDLWVRLTDHKGTPVLSPDEMREPLPGSIILTEGEHGTAWQRHFNDGLWHRAGGGSRRTWDELISKRNVVLVYDAAPREDRGTER